MRARICPRPAFVLFAFCIGCAAKPPAPAPSPEAGAAALEARRLDDPRLLAFIAASERLDPGRADPEAGAPVGPPPWTLRRLTLAALYFHPDLDVARSALALAEAGKVTAGERPNPNIAFVPPPFLFGAVVNAVIETGGKRGDRMAAANALAEAAREDLVTAGWQVRGGVRDAMLALWEARRRGELLAAEAAPEHELARAEAARLAAGAASAPEVGAIEIEVAALAAARSDNLKAQALAQARLARAIGVPLAALRGVALDFARFEHPPTLGADLAEGQLRRAALLGRSDVKAELASFAAADARLREELANRYPNLTLSPGYNWYQGINTYAIAPGFDLPILNQNQGRIGEALARRSQEAARFEALQARIIAALDEAGTAWRASAAGLRDADALVQAEAVRAREAAHAAAAGALDQPTILTTQIALAHAKLAWLDADGARLGAIGALEDALRQPLFDPGACVPDLVPPPRAEFAGAESPAR
jgi:outer membrane protein TolC